LCAASEAAASLAAHMKGLNLLKKRTLVMQKTPSFALG